MFCSITWQILALLLVFLIGCFGAERAKETGPSDPIQALKHRLSTFRGLEFTSEVPILIEDAENFKKRIDGSLVEDLRERRLADQSLAYAKLGLLPSGVDLRSTLLNLYSSRASGFYDSRRKRIVLLKGEKPDRRPDSPFGEGIDARVVVHELTHALQDQHFGLSEKLRLSSNSDKILALRSVAEGDAILSEYAYAFRGLHEWVPAHVLQIFDSKVEAPELSAVPPLIRDKLRFQNSAGLSFISRLVGNNGWLPINLIYKYPPSSEQVLHPEKYFESPDPPTRINLKNLPGLFSPEWREIENDTLGELMVHCLFKGFLGPEEAARVANGWDGDRFVAYRRGNEIAFVWATIWDSEKDAQDFFERYQRIQSIKANSRSLPKGGFYIDRRKRIVLVVEGLEAEGIKRNIETIWAEMVLEEENFQPLPFGLWISSR